MVRRLRSGTFAAAWLDQIVSSASNFVLMILLARVANLQTFGTLAIGYSILTLAVSIERSALGVRLGIDLAERADRPAGIVTRHIALASTCSLLLGSASSVCLVIVAFMSQHGAGPMFLLAAAAPVVLLEDIWRYAANAVRRPGASLVGDGLWLLVITVELGRSVVADVSPTEAVSVWLFGGVLGCLVLLRSPVPVGVGFRGARAFISRGGRFSLAADGALAGLTPVAIALVVSAGASVAVYGTIRAAATLFGVVNTLTSGVSLALVPALAARRPANALRLCLAVAATMAAVAGIWGLILELAPATVGQQLLGASWDSAHHIVGLAALEYASVAVWVCGNALLRVRAHTRVNLRVRILHLATCSAALAVAGAAGASVVVLASILAGAALGAASWTVLAATRSTQAASALETAHARPRLG